MSRDPAMGKALNGHASSSEKQPAVQLTLQDVVLGDRIIKPWYPSFYPEELVSRETQRLFVCQWCFKYSVDASVFYSHVLACPAMLGGIPGTVIYESEKYLIHEVDGDNEKLFAQNLSLFAKLFLDTKSVFYDVTTFLYYILSEKKPNVSASEEGNLAVQQVVGFFSKEKMSWDNNNLACILVFPPWQQRGLGQLMMGASYELSKRDQKLGGPEKPLSTLGARSYQIYWAHTLARYLLSHPAKRTLTINVISEDTYISPEDILHTLQSAMQVLDTKKRGNNETIIVNKAKVKAWATAHHVAAIGPVSFDDFLFSSERGHSSALSST